MAESTKSVERDEKMRVKLYMLNAGRAWDDQGTGYVSSTFAEKTKNMYLIVKEENKNTVLLESKIQLTTAYQKQQETLIVWSEAENFDYALSFQNKAGCDEVWAQICQVQGKDPSVEVTQEIPMEHDDADVDDDRFEGMGSGHLGGSDGDSRVTMVLPACEIAKLDDIVEFFQSSLPSPIKRERLSDLIEQEDYISKLVELFRMSEDLDDMTSLRRLYSIFKSLFLLNKSPVFEAMFADDVIFDVIGALEYDPSLARVTRHRDFLRRQTNLKQAVPIHNPELIQKIHQTYRVQYIQDAILPAPSMFEENILSTLTSFVYFNKVEIVTAIQEDETYLQTMFKHLTDDETDELTRRNIMSFLKEFCTMSQNLAQQNREEFFKVLTNLGILSALEIILGMDDVISKWLAVDIFSSVVEFNASIVRDFFLREIHKQEDEDLLINMVIEQMFTDLDPELGGALQLIGVIRLLVDPENMNSTLKNEKTEFLSNFYPHCMHVLTAPLFANTTQDTPCKDDYQTAQMQALILDLLTFCVEHHAYHIKTYMINKHLLKRSLTLLSSNHGFLQLASLRLLRRTIGLKDEFYHRHIVKFDLLGGVVDAFVRNGPRYNLLNSAIIELFEFIKTEDIRSLMGHLVRRHISSFEGVSYVQTFNAIKHKYMHYSNANLSVDSLDFLSTTPLKPDQSMDEDEESWFDQDDDPDELKLNTHKMDSYSPKFNPRTNCSIGTLGRSPMPLYNNKRNTISFNLNFRQHLFNKPPTDTDAPLATPHLPETALATPHLSENPSEQTIFNPLKTSECPINNNNNNILNNTDAENNIKNNVSCDNGFVNIEDNINNNNNETSPCGHQSFSPSFLSPSSSLSVSPLNQSLFLESPPSSTSSPHPSTPSSSPQIAPSTPLSSSTTPPSSSTTPSTTTTPNSFTSTSSLNKTSVLKGLVDYDYEDDEEEEEEEEDEDIHKNTNSSSSSSIKNDKGDNDKSNDCPDVTTPKASGDFEVESKDEVVIGGHVGVDVEKITKDSCSLTTPNNQLNDKTTHKHATVLVGHKLVGTEGSSIDCVVGEVDDGGVKAQAVVKEGSCVDGRDMMGASKGDLCSAEESPAITTPISMEGMDDKTERSKVLEISRIVKDVGNTDNNDVTTNTQNPAHNNVLPNVTSESVANDQLSTANVVISPVNPIATPPTNTTNVNTPLNKTTITLDNKNTTSPQNKNKNLIDTSTTHNESKTTQFETKTTHNDNTTTIPSKNTTTTPSKNTTTTPSKNTTTTHNDLTITYKNDTTTTHANDLTTTTHNNDTTTTHNNDKVECMKRPMDADAHTAAKRPKNNS